MDLDSESNEGSLRKACLDPLEDAVVCLAKTGFGVCRAHSACLALWAWFFLFLSPTYLIRAKHSGLGQKEELKDQCPGTAGLFHAV